MVSKVKLLLYLLFISTIVVACGPERRDNRSSTTAQDTNIRDAVLDPDFEGFEDEEEIIEEEVEETKPCPPENLVPGSSPGLAMFRTPMRDADDNIHDIHDFCEDNDPEMRVTMLISSTMW